MGENFLSLPLTIVFFIAIAYLIFQARRKKVLNRRNRSDHQMKRDKTTGSFSASNNQDPKDAMEVFSVHLEQLQSLASAQPGGGHEPQAHVVQILAAIYTKLTELDRRIRVFERQAEEIKKNNIGVENP